VAVKGRPERTNWNRINSSKNWVLQTKFRAQILPTETDSKYRLRQKFDDKKEYDLSACPIMANVI
jgi:hypothetical protein